MIEIQTSRTDGKKDRYNGFRFCGKIKVGVFLAAFFMTLSVMVSPLYAKNTKTPILSPSSSTVKKAKDWAANKNATEEFVSLADLYWKIAPASGVDPTVAYAQAAHETGFGRFTGVLDASFRNPCGLKTTVGGENSDPGAHTVFPDWETGIKAHVDHLALYAGAAGYPRVNSPDPRHFLTLYGTATTVESLGGKWAPSVTYGERVLKSVLEIQQGVSLNALVESVEIKSVTVEAVQFNITVRNMSEIPWGEAGQFRLGFGVGHVNYRAYLMKGAIVQPGNAYVFTAVVARSEFDSKSILTVQMLQDGGGRLGKEKTTEFSAYDAKVQKDSASSSSNQKTISVTVVNTGFEAWSENQQIRLGGRLSNGDEIRCVLSENTKVLPGQSHTFNIKIPADVNLKKTNIQMQMLKEGVLWFGETQSYSSSN